MRCGLLVVFAIILSVFVIIEALPIQKSNKNGKF